MNLPEDPNDLINSSYDDSAGTGIDIQIELDRLAEIILDSFRIPFTRLTLVDEEELLGQLELIQLKLPNAFQEAQEIIDQKDQIIRHGVEYAQQVIQDAEEQANKLLDETGIIKRAQIEAQQIRDQVQQECDEIQEQMLAEVERMRRRAKQEFDDMQQAALAECAQIQQGADQYADQVLINLEDKLKEMLRVIRNGRQQLDNNN